MKKYQVTVKIYDDCLDITGYECILLSEGELEELKLKLSDDNKPLAREYHTLTGRTIYDFNVLFIKQIRENSWKVKQ